MDTHDAYIEAAPAALRPLLVQLRTVVGRALPRAEEVIAYNMPGFRVGKAIVVGYAAFAKQCGVYVAPGAIAALSEDIAAAGLKATKTGVTFAPKKPMPEALLTKLALASLESVAGD